MFYGERQIRIERHHRQQSSTEEDKSEFTINKQKDAKIEVTYDVPSYFNVFECGRNILDRLDVSYERVCMATAREVLLYEDVGFSTRP